MVSRPSWADLHVRQHEREIQMQRISIYAIVVMVLCCGTVSGGEQQKLAEQARQRFLKRFDVNRDGTVTPEESRSVLKKEQARRQLRQKADASRQKFLKRFDVNGDGKVTPEESRGVLQQEKARRELKRTADRSRAKFLRRFDANGDGKVPPEESRAVLAKERAERNK